MNTQHANCAHPKRYIHRFGGRRRQCAYCHATWRIRQKKRGRKPRRISNTLITDYLSGVLGTIRRGAAKRHVTRSSMQRTLTRSLARFVENHKDQWHMLLPRLGKLILVADAIWYYVGGQKHSIYVFLLRPRKSADAVILPPVLLSGHENIDDWVRALNSIPAHIRRRIGVLVCDGGTGITNLAYRQGWLLQRCQFHQLAAFQNYLTTGPRSKHPDFARKVLGLVQRTFATRSRQELEHILRVLASIRSRSRSKGLRRVLGGHALHIREFRMYLERPEWILPATSNAAESFIQCIRHFLYVHRGFRTREKLSLWLSAIAAHKKTIRCNGKRQPN